MNQRRDPFSPPKTTAPDIYDQLRLAEPRKRNRHWEKEHLSRKAVYRGVDPRLALRVKQLAGGIQVPEGEVARFLLEYALQAYASGELVLSPYPDPRRMRMTLFPADIPSQRAGLTYTPRKPRRGQEPGSSWRVITTWRGFSPELKDEISCLASEAGLNVPVGELVTALLRFSLKAHECGLLKLEPVPRIAGHTLQEGTGG